MNATFALIFSMLSLVFGLIGDNNKNKTIRIISIVFWCVCTIYMTIYLTKAIIEII